MKIKIELISLFIVNFLFEFVNNWIWKKNNLIIYVKTYFLISFLVYFKYIDYINFTSLLDISVLDYLSNFKNRFNIIYTFWCYNLKKRIYVKIFYRHDFGVLSIKNLYMNANWLEREIWDMFGLIFRNHGDLRRILTDYGFKGFPLRKDFPLMGYMEIYFDELIQNIGFCLVELAQGFRYYKFENAWFKWKN